MNGPRFQYGQATTRPVTNNDVSNVDLDQGEIDLVNKGFKSESASHKVSFGSVDLTTLIVDDRIQRPVDTAEVNAIANDFNAAALGTLTVSIRTDANDEIQFILIDGQQRTNAALKVGYNQRVRAVFHEGLTLADEARLFRQLNFRKSVNAQVLFKVALSEGDPEAIAIQNVLDGMGLKLSSTSGFGAVTVARRIVRRRGGLTHFHWALEMIRKIYDPEAKTTYDGRVVEALAMMHEHYLTRIDEANLIKKLAAKEGGMPGLLGHGRTVRQVKGGHIVPAIIDAIVLRYNASKHANSPSTLPEWPRRKTPPVRAKVSRKGAAKTETTPAAETVTEETA